VCYNALNLSVQGIDWSNNDDEQTKINCVHSGEQLKLHRWNNDTFYNYNRSNMQSG